MGDDDYLWTFLRDSDLSAGSIRRHFIEFYGRLPFDPLYTDLLSRFLMRSRQPPVHCWSTAQEGRIAPE